MTIKYALQQLLDSQSLTREEMRAVMLQIMTGATSDAQMASFLIALRCKGETVDEITAAVAVMRELALPIHITGKHLIDTCGTGGDGANTFNISTTVAFVVAAAGGVVAKHGNRSVSSTCGSADVLEAAGVNLNASSDVITDCIQKIGIGFLFAPKHHGAMKHTIAVRQEMGVRTLFNLLGPLSNPAAAKNQLIGVFAKQWVEPLAQVLKNLGSEHVLVVHADDGLDEISIASPTFVAELNHGRIETYEITPEKMGLTRGCLSELSVTDAHSSLKILKSVLDNQSGVAKDIVLLNAGAAIYAANLTDSLQSGVLKAEDVIASGAAREKLNQLIHHCNTT
ncbi:MAG: anthranilate phosphoribosyltransferase [Methylococcales bacterium]|nr:anthranilate phosphoribosyltransferase [Methylococcales bacterium]